MVKIDLDLETLQRLKQLVGATLYDFLGFTIDLEKATIVDNLCQTHELGEGAISMLTLLFKHYSKSKPEEQSGKLVKFRDLPCGCAYEEAFIQRAINPVADVFGEKPDDLPKAAVLLGGRQMEIGDASAQIQALKNVPLTFILWGSDEFTASANVLYDELASSYLPTEDLAILGEFTTHRLIEANKVLMQRQ